MPVFMIHVDSLLEKALCCQLTKACPRPTPSEALEYATRDLEYATREQYEIPKSLIQLTRKLGAGNLGMLRTPQTIAKFQHKFTGFIKKILCVLAGCMCCRKSG